MIGQNSKSQVLKPQKNPKRTKVNKQNPKQINKTPENTKRRDLTTWKWVKETGLHRKLKITQSVPVSFCLLKYYT